MPWQYVQNSGHLYHDGVLVGTGWAGRNIENVANGRNNPAAQNVHGIGPIPVGFYTRGKVFDSPTKGVATIPLIPDPTNEMFGRGSFEMHGFQIGSRSDDPYNSSSDGCIIQEHDSRVQFGASLDTRLQVISGESSV